LISLTRHWLRFKRFAVQTILHADDTPHAIALGAALALLVAFLPLVGIQTMFAIGLAALFRANKAVCIPVVWITNPITVGPIYWGCYVVGKMVVPTSWTGNDHGLTRLLEVAKTGSLFDAAFWRDLFLVLKDAGIELWIGSIIIGMVAAVIGYFATRALVVAHRERRRQRTLRRTLFRASRLPTPERKGRQGEAA
jgi:uncharacterized protein